MSDRVFALPVGAAILISLAEAIALILQHCGTGHCVRPEHKSGPHPLQLWARGQDNPAHPLSGPHSKVGEPTFAAVRKKHASREPSRAPLFLW